MDNCCVFRVKLSVKNEGIHLIIWIKVMSSNSCITLSILAVNVGAFAVGSHYSWTSPALPKLTAKDSWLPVDTLQASLIGSLISFSSIFGPFIGGFTVDKVGRKGSATLAVLLGLLAWLVLYFSTQVWHIYVSRVIAGLAGGVLFTSVPLYLAEIAEFYFCKII